MYRKCFILALLLMPVAVHAANGAESATRTAKIKSAFVLNFIRYTTWPNADSGSEQAAPLRVVMIGNDSVMTAALKQTLRGVTVAGRQIELIHETMPSPPEADSEASHAAYHETKVRLTNQMRSSHLLFVCRDQSSQLKDILEMTRGSASLTVSDIAGFAAEGGMLGLVLRDNRVSFDANPEAIAFANIKVSAKVLRLAHIVKPRAGGER